MGKPLLFVDVETSARPDSLNHPISALDKWPYLLQVAWEVYDQEGNQLLSENHYLHHEEISIDKSSQNIHGLTVAELAKVGEKRKDVIRQLGNHLRYHKPIVVGHFIEFDSKMLQVAMLRAGLKNILKDYPHFDTMKATSDYNFHPDQQYPKLEQLYQRLFSEKMENAHDALSDVQATAKCFFELVLRGEIKPAEMELSFYSKVKEQVNKKTGCGLPVLVIVALLIWML